MSYPGGGPGGYPGQGPQQPQPGPGYGPPTAGGMKLGLPQIAYLVVGGLGVLNLFMGFASLGAEQNFYELFSGWVPGLLLISGLTALFGILPGDHKPGAWPAVFALGATLPYMFFVFSAEGDLETGGTLVMIFGILQTLAAIGAYLLDVGLVKLPAPNQPQYGHPGGYGPPPGQFPPQQQPGQYGQTQQYPPQPGQYPPQQPPGQHPGTPPGGYPQQG